MKNTNSIPFIGYASGIAAGDVGCGDGPSLLQKTNLLAELARVGIQAHWQGMLCPQKFPEKLAIVAELCTRLAQETNTCVQKNELFVVFGGDHACAVGTWSGVASAKRAEGELGLIWIDAHLDSHTPETSESGNIHGMPVAHLLGQGASQLTKILDNDPKLRPEHLCLIGIRSFERGEEELIKRLGVRVYYMEEVKQRGIITILQEALRIVKQGTVGYGLSIDLDALDPLDAPAVGTPEVNGMSADELYQALKIIQNDPKLLGIEIAEFNPHHDRNKQTEQVIQQLLKILLGKNEGELKS